MKIQGQHTFDASRATVWKAVMDPEIIAKVMPGCQALEEIGDNHLVAASEREIEGLVQGFVNRVLANEELPLNETERTRLADELTAETVGMGPLAPLMADPAVTDILVNGPTSVYVERFGRLEKTSIRFQDADHVVRVIERIASRVGRRIAPRHFRR